jgi:hypothetical protein
MGVLAQELVVEVQQVNHGPVGQRGVDGGRAQPHANNGALAVAGGNVLDVPGDIEGFLVAGRRQPYGGGVDHHAFAGVHHPRRQIFKTSVQGKPDKPPG